MPDTAVETEATKDKGKGPCEACEADFCEFD